MECDLIFMISSDMALEFELQTYAKEENRQSPIVKFLNCRRARLIFLVQNGILGQWHAGIGVDLRLIDLGNKKPGLGPGII